MVTKHQRQPEWLFDQWFLGTSKIMSAKLPWSMNGLKLQSYVTADMDSAFCMVPVRAATPNGFTYATGDEVTLNFSQQTENLDLSHWL